MPALRPKILELKPNRTYKSSPPGVYLIMLTIRKLFINWVIVHPNLLMYEYKASSLLIHLGPHKAIVSQNYYIRSLVSQSRWFQGNMFAPSSMLREFKLGYCQWIFSA